MRSLFFYLNTASLQTDRTFYFFSSACPLLPCESRVEPKYRRAK